MFGPNGLPLSQRTTLEGSVRMTIEASQLEEEEQENSEDQEN